MSVRTYDKTGEDIREAVEARLAVKHAEEQWRLVDAEWAPSPKPRPAVEVRQTDRSTGGQKGAKPERLELIPQQALLELARVYGHGAQKYTDYNYIRGYKWSLSVAALQRHLAAWLLGENKDQESGLSHLAHVAWHAFTLMTYQRYKLGVDDRIGAWLEQGRPESTIFADAMPRPASDD